MGIDQEDYAAFKKHLGATLATFNVPERECNDVMAFITSIENDIVEK
jgi:hemoglobin